MLNWECFSACWWKFFANIRSAFLFTYFHVQKTIKEVPCYMLIMNIAFLKLFETSQMSLKLWQFHISFVFLLGPVNDGLCWGCLWTAFSLSISRLHVGSFFCCSCTFFAWIILLDTWVTANKSTINIIFYHSKIIGILNRYMDVYRLSVSVQYSVRTIQAVSVRTILISDVNEDLLVNIRLGSVGTWQM